MSDKLAAFERGRQMFRDGTFRPQVGMADEEWEGPCTEEQCVWLGWMIERAEKLQAFYKASDLQERLRDWAEHGHLLPDEYRE